MISCSKNSLHRIIEEFEDEPRDNQSVENDSDSAGSKSTGNYIEEILEQLVFNDDIDEKHTKSQTKASSKAGTKKTSYRAKTKKAANPKEKFEHEIVFTKTTNERSTLRSDDDFDSTNELIKSIAYQRGYLCDDHPTLPSLESDSEIPTSDAVVTLVDDARRTDNVPIEKLHASNTTILDFFKHFCRKFVNNYKYGCMMISFIFLVILFSLIFLYGLQSRADADNGSHLADTVHHQNTKLKDILTLFGFHPQPSSPQFMAIEFLANEDTDNHIPSNDIKALLLDLEQKKNNKESSYLFQRLIQRYVVLTIYFSMTSYKNWNGFNQLMQVRLHECNWPGVMCNRDKVVTDIKSNENIGRLRGTIPTEIGLLSELGKLINVRTITTLK
jgi:hypothetical protein